MEGVDMISAFADNNFRFAEPKLANDVVMAALACGFEDPAQVSDEYEAFMFQRPKVVDVVSTELVESFRAYLRKNKRDSEKENTIELGFHSRNDWDSLASVITPTKTPGRQTTRKSSIGDYATPAPSATGTGSKTPQSSATALLMKASPNTSFQGRAQGGKVQLQLNGDLPAVTIASAAELQVEPLGQTLETDARYISDSLKDKALYIEGRILELVSLLEASEGKVDATYPVCSPAQEPVVVAGRIVCDSDGRLNPQSVLLEGSMRHSGGQRVRLDLSKLPSFNLFPGQVLAVEGFNPSGSAFTATRILPHPEEAQAQSQEVSAHSTVVACGPFTTVENIAYEPLQELMDYCQKEKPSLLVLMGPFVDVEHPHICSGQLDITFDDLFAAKVRNHVEIYLQGQGSGTQVVLIPSLRDVHHHPVFPQPPMQSDAFDPPGVVSCLPNPATWRSAGMFYGATTTDVMRHLSSADLRRGQADRMLQLGSYVIGQKSYYPMYPPAPGVNFDSALASSHMSMPEVPNVLLAPSDLAPCAKTLEHGSGCVLVNPGRLSKGASGGTFAHLHVQPASGSSGVRAAIRVDIIRI